MKTRIDLLPPTAIKECGMVMAHGATKYGASGTWAEQPIEYHIERALRHLNAFQIGETRELESGLHHLAHAAVRCMFAAHLTLHHGQNQNSVETR